jgi:glycine oxidase
LDTSGALIEAPSAPAMKIWLGRAEALGAALAPVTQAQAQRLAPGLAAPGPFLFTPEDGRLEPADMLAALHRALAGQGGERLSQAALGLADGQVSLAGSTPLQADALVMATGAGPGLTPIKGQILRFRGFGPITGPVVRGQGVYAAPSPHGLIVGATMEEGLSDRTIDPDAVAQLRAGAARLFPQVAQAPALAAAAVRAATSDGLPLVGPSGPPGLILAQGARRNGWLLAPLIAEVVCDRLAQRAPSVAARAFDPRRFASS